MSIKKKLKKALSNIKFKKAVKELEQNSVPLDPKSVINNSETQNEFINLSATELYRKSKGYDRKVGFVEVEGRVKNATEAILFEDKK